MRCPKCHYLSFEPEPRCKNCGHDLSIPGEDLALKAFAPEMRPPADLALRAFPEEVTAPAPRAPRPAPVREPRRPAATVQPTSFGAPSATAVLPAILPDEDEIAQDAPPAAEPTDMPAEVQAVLRRAEVRPAPTAELPLFVKGLPVGDGASMLEAAEDAAVHVPAAPPPLAVRRKAPDSAPQRARTVVPPRKLGPLDRDLLEDLQRIEKAERRDAAAQARRDAREALHAASDRAGAGRRAAAAAIDASFLGGISAAVVWITLRWCELPLDSARILPLAPTAAFLLLVGGGYLLMFTAAGGQTIGKMLVGLRVVAGDAPDDEGALTFGQAAYRSLLAVPSVLALGAGFIPALFGDERSLHDRLAHTRVVRA